MAKKNSTKVASQEARKRSEPKVQVYGAWTGMNLQQQPLDWSASDNESNQTDLPFPYLMIQNNVITTPNKTLETRGDETLIAPVSIGMRFTGVICLCGEWIIAVMARTNDGTEFLYKRRIGGATWSSISIQDADSAGKYVIKSVNYYANTLAIFTQIDYTGIANPDPWGHEIFTGTIAADGTPPAEVRSTLYVPTPSVAAGFAAKGDVAEVAAAEAVSRITLCYSYVNKFGSTLPGPTKTVTLNKSPLEWNFEDYATISNRVAPPNGETPQLANRPYSILAVDIYATENDSTDFIFIGRAPVVWVAADGADYPGYWFWSYNWLGALSDNSEWTNVSLTVPKENTTKGVNASYMNYHDGRVYFWGGDIPYRLWIGGGPGAELSVSRGLGGGYVDIEPGAGMIINSTHKFLTFNGASIVTIMCGNENSSKVKRYNLVENNIALTSEVSAKGYMYEEVSNVVGCNSPWGSGVFADGLYTITRYGLAVTTRAMESSNQLNAKYASDAISPIFDWRIARRLKNARMIHVNGIIYIALADDEESVGVGSLDNVILCYDVAMKAWYLITLTLPAGDNILHMFQIDHEDYHEGIGIVTESNIYMLPTTDKPDITKPAFDIQLETGELSTRVPLQDVNYLCQVELVFDYFIGDLQVVIKGVDYYGRSVTITKDINHNTLIRNLCEFIRVDMLLRSWNMTLIGRARMRLTHYFGKYYLNSRKIGLVYGQDTSSTYVDANDVAGTMHHELDSYNNLRAALVT